MKAPQKSLKKWTKQKWRTKSGKPSAKTGERYLPEKAIKSLSSAEYAATTKAKREGTAEGKQFVKQPKKIAEKVKKFRAAEGGMAMKFKTCAGCPTPQKCTAAGKCLGKSSKSKAGMSKGGVAKMGYNKGGYVNCGASMKPNGKTRK